MSTLTARLVGASRLDNGIYEEVEADKGATPQAMLVVVASSIAGGIGTAGLDGFSATVLVTGTVAALIGWGAWAFLTYIIGTQFLPESETRADVGELLRTTGFASAPGLIRVVGIVPGLASVVFVVALFWMLATMIVAVRQALDYKSTGRAFLVCFIGWLVSIAIALVVGIFMGPTVQ
jgi:hypothetical protein